MIFSNAMFAINLLLTILLFLHFGVIKMSDIRAEAGMVHGFFFLGHISLCILTWFVFAIAHSIHLLS